MPAPRSPTASPRPRAGPSAAHDASDDLPRLEALFHGALARPEPARAGWVRAQCADRPELAREVLALLSADAAAPGPGAPLSYPAGFLADLLPDVETGTDRTGDTRVGPSQDGRGDGGAGLGAAPLASDAADGPRGRAGAPAVRPLLAPGDRVGSYRIVRVLGRGGMGTVFLAEHEDVRQAAAIKVVRATRAHSGRARALFFAERRALARLSHPNIARLLGAGVVEGGPAHGAPWFAMEYVDGLPIDEACDARRLGVRARLALFTQLCEAVEAVHRQHVVHRDLKPSNVLVTADGRPVLLDFGVAAELDAARRGDARAAEAAAAAAGTRTGPHAAYLVSAPGPLTPQYAAPEQVRDEPPSVAGDVYALGLVLYELLTGCRPYELRGLTRGDAVRAVLTARVRRPSESAALGDDAPTRAAARGTRPEALRRALRGDIDAVVLRALAPDPAARYPTARALCDDVRRALEHRPIEARGGRGPARLAYVAGRLVRRRRSAAAAALLLATAGASALAREAHWERVARLAHARAEQAAARCGGGAARAPGRPGDAVRLPAPPPR